MPVRTYTGIDLINYLLTDTSNHGSTNGSSSAVVTGVSQGVVTGTGAGADTQPGMSTFSNIQYTVAGDFDFDAFPAIPDNASITSIRVKVAYNLSGNASGSSTGGGDLSAVAQVLGSVELPAGSSLPNLFVFTADGPEVAAAPNVAVNEALTFSTEQELIIGPPITKAQLVASFGDILITILGSGVIGENSGIITTATGSVSTSADLDNFQVIVTYDSGPELVLNPSGGNVEPGQYITVTGPVEGVEFAALQDDKVIPIIPKIIGPNEVQIPVPIPPTDDCTGCLAGDCTECDTCFDACENDLTSEKCQECIDACLDCLVECLENLELGEDCQQSSQDPPEIPIVIICGGPKFVGSVPLGNFTILVARASGIYRFIPNKTNDTLYATARDGTTYDVAIPKPFGKTGFFQS